MNRIILHMILLSIAVIGMAGCSNDFLKNNVKDGAQVSDTVYMNYLDTICPLKISVPNGGNSKWTMRKYPTFLNLSSLGGMLANGEAGIDLTIVRSKANFADKRQVMSFLVEIENKGLLEIPFVFSSNGSVSVYGDPYIAIVNQTIDFTNKPTQDLVMYNQNRGSVFTWKIIKKPDWLTISTSVGNPTDTEALVFKLTANKDSVAAGSHNDTIRIFNNSQKSIIEIYVTVQAYNYLKGNSQAVDGNVVSAEYSKEADVLGMVCTYPNRIYLLDTKANTERIISLDDSQIPVCATFSQKMDTVLIGYKSSQVLELRDLKNNITRNIPISAVPYSLAFGNNGWAYVAPAVSTGLRSVNLATGGCYTCSASDYGWSVIKKIPGKPMVVTTNPGYQPSGLNFYKAENGRLLNNNNEYGIYGGNMWFTEDGGLTFVKDQNRVYTTPEFKSGTYYNENQIELKNTFQTSNLTYFQTSAFDYNNTIKRFWCGVSDLTVSSSVYEFDAVTYAVKKEYRIKDVTDSGGNSLRTDVQSLFSNKAGTKMYILKKQNYSWFLDTVIL